MMVAEGLSTGEQVAFDGLVEAYDLADEITVDEGILVTGGMTSVMRRAQAAANEQIFLTDAGVSDVNADMSAFQSEV